MSSKVAPATRRGTKSGAKGSEKETIDHYKKMLKHLEAFDEAVRDGTVA